MKISIVVAMGSNYVIGRDNDLPWRGKLPADMKHFKDITMNHPVIMGRKTYDSIPPKYRPLRGRTNIVLTRRDDYVPSGAFVAGSLEEAVARCGSEQVFILGGAEVYTIALPLTDEIYLTLIHQDFEGDARFPPLDLLRVWREVEREDHEPDEKNKFRYSFVHLVRR